ncbi:hypothetical protein [Komagataeibacter swingsii]|uniref:hypothetical protein n=1 Tax=Komagataeibacter swingsii TaxID=215220 RepID=UPI001FC9F095|nr:hypothetical protein [Komagataeibacter swingsii]GBQ58832.1 hypothetical protein AA16373_1378 [Komagataeibacter swingsii DSM 16373]
MDRQIVYPAQIPLDSDQLNAQRNAYVGLGQLAAMAYGWATIAASGFACTPGDGLALTVAPGSLVAPGVIDAVPYGTLGAVASASVKQFTSRDPVSLTVPGTGAAYTVYVAGITQDADYTVLPFYNAADPSVTYAGAGNSGQSAPTVRQDLARLGIGASIPDGSLPLWTITVPSGATAITADMITQANGAPFYDTIPQLQAGKQDTLGFTPVQQGGGTDQTDDKVCIGNASDISGILRYRAGTTDMGPLVSGQYGAVSANGDVPIYAQYWSITGRPMVGYGETGAAINWQLIATYADVTTETSDRVAAVSAVQSQLPDYVSGIWYMSGADQQVNGLTVSGNTGRPQVFTVAADYTLGLYSDVTTETSDRVAAVSAVQSQLPNYVSGIWALSGSDVQVNGLTVSGNTGRPQVFTATTIYELAENGDVSLMPFSATGTDVASGSATLTFTPTKSGTLKIDYNAGTAGSAKMTNWGLSATGATYLGGAGNNAGANLLAGSALYSVTAGVTAAITLSVTFSASTPEVLVGGTAIFVAS